MKIRCLRCDAMATWVYSPNDGDGHYCDACVPRGCSCWWNEELQEFDRDDAGREMPCIEYRECEGGFDNEEPLDASDKWSEYEGE